MECDSRKYFLKERFVRFNKEKSKNAVTAEQFEEDDCQTADIYGQKEVLKIVLTPPVVHNDILLF